MRPTYTVGDVVQLVDKRHHAWNPRGEMDKYIGMVVTITKVLSSGNFEFVGMGEWSFGQSCIKGYAKNKIVHDILSDL